MSLGFMNERGLMVYSVPMLSPVIPPVYMGAPSTTHSGSFEALSDASPRMRTVRRARMLSSLLLNPFDTCIPGTMPSSRLSTRLTGISSSFLELT